MPHEGLAENLASCGVTFESVAERMKETLGSQSDEVKLASWINYFRLTTGFAPTTTHSKSLQLHGKADKFFESGIFENPPAPKLDEES